VVNPIRKEHIVDGICQQLQLELETAQTAAESAREGATHQDSKAENQYDTRGLESSYLAGAQAERVLQLAESLHRFKELSIREYTEESKIGITALIELDDGGTKQLYFLVGSNGGMKIKVKDQSIMVITLDSPLGRALRGKTNGDIVELKVRNKTREFEITKLS
jgi:transcription elongation GreA/GreB family factor